MFGLFACVPIFISVLLEPWVFPVLIWIFKCHNLPYIVIWLSGCQEKLRRKKIFKDSKSIGRNAHGLKMWKMSFDSFVFPTKQISFKKTVTKLVNFTLTLMKNFKKTIEFFVRNPSKMHQKYCIQFNVLRGFTCLAQNNWICLAGFSFLRPVFDSHLWVAKE